MSTVISVILSIHPLIIIQTLHLTTICNEMKLSLQTTGSRRTYKYKANSKSSHIRRSMSSASSDDEKSGGIDGDGGDDESSSDDDDEED